jgi:hypothetical protein
MRGLLRIAVLAVLAPIWAAISSVCTLPAIAAGTYPHVGVVFRKGGEEVTGPCVVGVAKGLVRYTFSHPEKIDIRGEILRPIDSLFICPHIIDSWYMRITHSSLAHSRMVFTEILRNMFSLTDIPVWGLFNNVKKIGNLFICCWRPSNISVVCTNLERFSQRSRSGKGDFSRCDPCPLGRFGDFSDSLYCVGGIVQRLIRRTKHHIRKASLDGQNSAEKGKLNFNVRQTAARLAPTLLTICGFLVALIGLFMINWGSTLWKICGTIVVAFAWAGIGFGWEHAQSLSDKWKTGRS